MLRATRVQRWRNNVNVATQRRTLSRVESVASLGGGRTSRVTPSRGDTRMKFFKMLPNLERTEEHSGQATYEGGSCDETTAKIR